MGIPNAVGREVVRAIVDDFMTGKAEETLAAVSQDDIDVHVIPILEAIEAEAVRIITSASADAFKKRRNNADIPWWEDQ